MTRPTQQRLKELFDYDPETGVFVRKIQCGSRGVKGAVAGSDDGAGYLQIRVDGKVYRAHVLAWVYTHGYWPSEIDHKNRVRSDNRIENLREGVYANAQNRGLDRRNITGCKGVSWDPGRQKWRVQLAVNGKRVLRKRFDSLPEAIAARTSAEQQHGYNC